MRTKQDAMLARTSILIVLLTVGTATSNQLTVEAFAGVKLQHRARSPAVADKPVDKQCVRDNRSVCASTLIQQCRSGKSLATFNEVLTCDVLITAAAVKEFGSASRLVQACNDGPPYDAFVDANVGCGCPIYSDALCIDRTWDDLIASQLDNSLYVYDFCVEGGYPITTLYYTPPVTYDAHAGDYIGAKIVDAAGRVLG
ncbi:hypothetical protein WJX72_003592 [[Myrmecia] bisecta]|uniref:Uncharacterized protein n=1 Tax=[Myrmecia] bisecta TaxID=41462 RepID=A0AAW1QQ18_9CHLO